MRSSQKGTNTFKCSSGHLLLWNKHFAKNDYLYRIVTCIEGTIFCCALCALIVCSSASSSPMCSKDVLNNSLTCGKSVSQDQNEHFQYYTPLLLSTSPLEYSRSGLGKQEWVLMRRIQIYYRYCTGLRTQKSLGWRVWSLKRGTDCHWKECLSMSLGIRCTIFSLI